jgi:hypothetical protein
VPVDRQVELEQIVAELHHAAGDKHAPHFAVRQRVRRTRLERGLRFAGGKDATPHEQQRDGDHRLRSDDQTRGCMAQGVDRKPGEQGAGETRHRPGEAEVAEVARAFLRPAQRPDEVLQGDVEKCEREAVQRRRDV